MELAEPVFGKAPEALDAIDMVWSQGELVVAMIDSAVLVVADFDQPVVSSPSIGVKYGFQIGFATDNGLQRGFGGIGYDLGVDLVASFQQPKDDGFSTCSAASSAAHAPRAEIGFIGLQLALEGRTTPAFLGESFAQTEKELVHAAQRNTAHLGRLRR